MSAHHRVTTPRCQESAPVRQVGGTPAAHLACSSRGAPSKRAPVGPLPLHGRSIGVGIPELGDRVGIERPENLRRQRVDFDLDQLAVARDEPRRATVGVLAGLRRECILLDLVGGQCDTSHLLPAVRLLDEIPVDVFAARIVIAGIQQHGGTLRGGGIRDHLRFETLRTIATEREHRQSECTKPRAELLDDARLLDAQ